MNQPSPESRPVALPPPGRAPHPRPVPPALPPAPKLAPQPPLTTFWFAFWLGIIMILCKSCHLPIPDELSWKNIRISAQNLAIYSSADIVFAISLGLIGQFILWLCKPVKLLQRIVWAVLLLFFTLCAMYAICCVKVFEFLNRPLTYNLFYLGGDVKDMQSSVGRFMTWQYTLSIIASPFIYWGAIMLSIGRWRSALLRFARAFLIINAADILILWSICAGLLVASLPSPIILQDLVAPLPWLSTKLTQGLDKMPLAQVNARIILIALTYLLIPLLLVILYHLIFGLPRRAPASAAPADPATPPRQPASPALFAARLGATLLLSAAIIFALIPQGEVRGVWGAQHIDRRIAYSPHYAVISSTVRELFFSSSVRLSESYPPDYQDDFKTVAQRGGNAGQPTPDLRRGPKNIIIIVGESLGAQHMQIYGSKFPTTPNLVAEASNSLIIDNFYSHVTNTANSMIPLLLSEYAPPTWREWTIERPDFPGTSLAQVLKQNGYHTAFITGADNNYANQIAFLRSHNNRGFDLIQDYHDTGTPPPPSWEFSWGVRDKDYMDMVIRYLDQRKPGEKFCLFTWSQGTHHPYYAGPDHQEIYFQNADDKARAGKMWWDLHNYLNAIHELDAQLGRLFAELRRLGMADDTLVVITGDHGQCFGYPHPLYGHGFNCYQENLHVPCIFWNPAIFKDRSRSKTIGAHVDLNPTILDLLGIAAPPPWQGRSLFDPQKSPRAYFFAATGDYIFALRDSEWKYIYNLEVGHEELFDLATDPDEQTNLADQHPDVTRTFRKRLAAWLDYETTASTAK